jgi:hypothetical protein
MRKSKKEDIESQATLGKHLLQFLKFWSEFDFQRTGIYVKNGGGLFEKVRIATDVLQADCSSVYSFDVGNINREANLWTAF